MDVPDRIENITEAKAILVNEGLDMTMPVADRAAAMVVLAMLGEDVSKFEFDADMLVVIKTINDFMSPLKNLSDDKASAGQLATMLAGLTKTRRAIVTAALKIQGISVDEKSKNIDTLTRQLLQSRESVIAQGPPQRFVSVVKSQGWAETILQVLESEVGNLRLLIPSSPCRTARIGVKSGATWNCRNWPARCSPFGRYSMVG